MVRGTARAIALILFAGAAWATGSSHHNDDVRVDQDQHQGQEQGQEQDQHQGQEQSNQVSVETAAAGGAANNEGNELSVTSNYEGGPADLVLVPNNNTERCLRVFGFSFGNKDGSGMFGIPWRSKNCDYKGFASDADAQGNLELGWFWRCHMKSAYKVFKDKDESEDTAISQCHDKMIGAVGTLKTINTLTEQLEFERNERMIEREQASESRERIEMMCEESKNRIVAGCVGK